MPRPKKVQYPEGSAEWVEEQERLAAKRAEREANPPTDRAVTVRVSLEAVAAAKSLGTLSGLPYREVLATAAQHGVESLTEKVRVALNGATVDQDSGIPL